MLDLQRPAKEGFGPRRHDLAMGLGRVSEDRLSYAAHCRFDAEILLKFS